MASLHTALARFGRSQNGSVSVLAAISIVPVVLSIALLVDTGFAWSLRDKAFSGVEAAAALAAMHRPACINGQVLDGASAQASFEIATGLAPEQFSVTCTESGVDVEAHIVSPTALFRAVIGSEVTITARASAQSVKHAANPASGWERS